MMASVATPTMAARGGHAPQLARTGQRVAMANTLDVAKPASLATMVTPVAIAPPAILPHIDGRRSRVWTMATANVARSVTRGQEGQG